MASQLGLLLRRTATTASTSACRTSSSGAPRRAAAVAFRSFSTTPAPRERQKPSSGSGSGVDERRRVSVLEEDLEDLEQWFEDEVDPFDDIIDTPAGGHMLLQRQREVLHYMRLIEHEMPKLVAYRKPFVPPGPDTPLVVRSVHYQHESHPLTRKRVITVAVDDLPLTGDAAKHKFKLLAGPRWTPEQPKDGGLPAGSNAGNGYFKISCEDFPHPGANLKWASDALDQLVKEANDTKDTFSDVPLDLRHVFAKAKKAKKGQHIRDRVFERPSIRDFPKEWLPSEQQV